MVADLVNRNCFTSAFCRTGLDLAGEDDLRVLTEDDLADAGFSADLEASFCRTGVNDFLAPESGTSRNRSWSFGVVLAAAASAAGDPGSCGVEGNSAAAALSAAWTPPKATVSSMLRSSSSPMLWSDSRFEP